MKSKIIAGFFLIISSYIVKAQNCDGYIKTSDSLSISEFFAINGNSDIICNASTANGNRMVRMSANGIILWVKPLTGWGYFGCDGNNIFYLSDSTSNGVTDFYLKKYDLSGVVVNTVSLPVDAQFWDMEIDGNGNVVLLALANDTLVIGGNTLIPTPPSGGMQENMVLIKYNSNFSVAWSRFAYSAASYPGSNYDELITDGATGDIYLTMSGGNTGTAVDFGNSVTGTTSGYVLTKYNPSGVAQWTKTGIPSPPILDNWKVIGGNVYIFTLINGTGVQVDLTVHSVSTGSVVATHSTTVNSTFWPSSYFDNSNIYVVGNDPSGATFIEKYNHSLISINKKIFGNTTGGFMSAVNLRVLNSHIYFGTGDFKNHFYYPPFNDFQIAANDSVRFYGKTDVNGNLFPTNFLGNDDNILCGQNHTIDVTTNPSPFNLNASDLLYTYAPSQGLSVIAPGHYIASPAATTEYTFTVTSGGTCTYKDTVNVNVGLLSAFTYTVNNMVVNFSKQNAGCTSFIWDFGNGNTSTINPNPVVTYASPGTYGICLQCNSSSNCMQCINLTVPSFGSGGVGINEYANHGVYKVYPNPTLGKLKIIDEGLTRAKTTRVKIVDIVGKEVASLPYNEEIDISVLEAGIYFLTLFEDNNLIFTEKIIKE
ncbi:MAG: T9SS type A sorting domain-containing protein [Bacteroidota bacterium]|nr:T9SS type A sorting domain-containing protein [Bacteroidota bacterium]